MNWYIKQLFPLTYRAYYRQEGKKMFCVWKMWLDKCYKIDTVEIKD